jgi:hypothetical protein
MCEVIEKERSLCVIIKYSKKLIYQSDISLFLFYCWPLVLIRGRLFHFDTFLPTLEETKVGVSLNEMR